MESAGYRLVEEALANVVEHAGTARAGGDDRRLEIASEPGAGTTIRARIPSR